MMMSDVNLEMWKKANQVYGQLMDLTVSDALNQLSQMPDLDDELKSLVLTLISSGNQPSQYFKQNIGGSFQLDDMQQQVFKPGDQVGGYELLEELGVGGMAKVYKAKKTDVDSQKPVAIKLFNHHDVSATMLNRFAVEQEILSGLSHPHIVNMHHGGTNDQGVPFIVMELIEHATDIDQFAQQQHASLRKKIKWMVVAARAIAHAHNNLIVHRDIKPSNLMIDATGQLKVVDFGIAKLMTKDDKPHKTTIMALTPSFAAPEQINSGQISVTTDVFSLAAVCLSLIIEDLPLPANRLLKSCAEDEAHLWQVLKTKVTDKDLRNILNQALQQDPQKRYRNMDLFANDLSAWLDNKPVQATPDSWLYRIKKFAKRRSALFATLTTLLLMLVIGLTLLGWQVEKTQAEAAKANEVKDFMLEVFSVVNPDDALGDKILAKDLLLQAFAEIKAKDFSDQAIKVELLTAMGRAQLQLGLTQQAATAFDEALAINSNSLTAQMGALELMVANDDMDTAQSAVQQITTNFDLSPLQEAELSLLKSQIASQEGEYDLAEKLATDAQVNFEQFDHFKGYLKAGRQLVYVMYLRSESVSGAAYLERLLKEALQQLPPTNTVVLAIQTDLVELYNDVGEYPSAIKHSEQLVSNIKKVMGEKHPFLIQAYLGRAGTSRATGQIEEAQQYAQMAYDLSLEINGELHETTARALNFIAVISYVNGEIDLALQQMKQASVLFDQVLGDENPESWDVKTNLTVLLDMSKRYDEAIEIVKPVFEKQSIVLGTGHKSTIYSQTILARLYSNIERLDEAQELGENMLNEAVKSLGIGHPLTVGGHFSLAKIYQKQGKYQTGIELLQTIMNSADWSDDNERVISAYNTMADLYAGNKAFESAAAYKEKSVQVAINLLTEESPRTVEQMLKNAEFYWTIGNRDKTNYYAEKVALFLADPEHENTRLQDRLDALQADMAAASE